MKLPLKDITKKAMLVAVTAVIAGTGATAVFAAIPHSTTGVISGCRANSDGAVRVIDAEASASCNGSETAISWVSTGDGDSTHSALLRLEPNSQDATNYVVNQARSRNIVAVDIKPDTENEGYRYMCIQVAFTPEVFDIVSANQVGWGSNGTVQVELRSQEGANGEMIDYFCGGQYQAIITLTPSSGDAISQSIQFSN